MSIYLLDPHADDFIFTPLSFVIAGRRALKKYSYLSRLPGMQFIQSGCVSSLPASIQQILPHSILSILVKLESLLWQRLNQITFNQRPKFEADDVILLFGYKCAKAKLDYLLEQRFTGRVVLHLSHYHLFNIDQSYFDKLKLELAFDTDVSQSEYFRECFPNYDRSLMIIPFSVSPRFFNAKNSRSVGSINIVVTGTYHDFPLDSLPFVVEGRSTLHPDRYRFSKITTPENVANHLACYHSGDSSFVGMLLKFFRASQKKYFRVDLTELYSSHPYVFIGSEGTGAFGIGVLEAMACGAIPLLPVQHKNEGYFADNLADIVWYETFSELRTTIASLRGSFPEPSTLNKAIARNYTDEELIIRIGKTLC